MNVDKLLYLFQQKSKLSFFYFSPVFEPALWALVRNT